MLNMKYEAVVVNVIGMVKLNTVYKADSINTEVGIEVYQGRKPNMHEQPETRDEMLKITPKGKYGKNVNMDHVMDDKPEITDIIDAVMYEKPEMRDVMDDITYTVMLEHGVRGWHQDPLRKGTQHMREDRDEGWDAQHHCQGQVRQEQEREQCDEQEQHGRLDYRTEAVQLSV
jgi:hypothetical protein